MQLFSEPFARALVRSLTQLESLHLYGLDEISDETLEPVLNSTRLRDLRLTNNSGVSRSFLMNLIGVLERNQSQSIVI